MRKNHVATFSQLARENHTQISVRLVSPHDFNNASARSHTEMKQNKGMQSNSSITFLHDPTFSPYTNHQRAKPVYGRYGRVSHFTYH